jgi:hypothetical protein
MHTVVPHHMIMAAAGLQPALMVGRLPAMLIMAKLTATIRHHLPLIIRLQL